MADEEIKTEEVTEEAAEATEEVFEEKPITADIPYGKGLPTVLMPFMGPFDEIKDSIEYKAQLVARDQKLSSGVNASMPIGAIVGFLFALLMVLVPVYFMT
ncbi:MAG: tetrahydromethanopterin S-methyltransferase subunit F [Methanothrix sp.]|jgi:tetrahydromethanopterin S-methyltransferase subunit F|uniref:Tetrahydromethanopterin S-methyltransferase subunit F n=1 Tax=Methanothrix harundinacea TaxID=301375 RepID=A0A117MD70_9EURY|nr:MAG: Tetrahydromethanopterin S-methyltransferase subunit F [Methanothrix harundinacea]KUK97497.1 MAG: Tetrahydromethanopterin S-methyltransferase subunit F [Methanothrix harundinacea]MCP1392214.1 tetrahydromethanopterin S-methyltransferase subunit F [Methanothrix harundinacea]MDD2638523.1 tetrahydromethanopterin S-methyltransferase subunit F [Methanothrix sp.]MDD3709761.1 tetrahydromethanopterin S-methyltransferase subunit F [Methanothrix sp.]